MKRVATYALVALTAFSTPLPAQDSSDADEESGGLLVGFLEDTLSGDSRHIRVVGLEGALSSQATIERIEVSDDTGIWLTIENAVLDWNRLALLRGRFSVNALTAEKIAVERPPEPVETGPDLPAPEAQPFQVPELPVSIEIGEIAINSLTLGEPVVGMAAELNLKGAITLADGTLDAQLAMDRLDQPTDRVNITAGFANETGLITVDLLLEEGRDGLLSELLKLPGRPSVTFAAKGEGPVEDFTADIRLATDGQDRLEGQVNLKDAVAPSAAPDAPPSIEFTAALEGDVTPILEADYQAFFGTDTALDVHGRRDPDGRLHLERLHIASNAFVLSGEAELGPENGLESLLMAGRIASADGNEVVLPIPGEKTSIAAARVTVEMDRAVSNDWGINLTVDRLVQSQMSVETAVIKGGGTLDPGTGVHLDGRINAALEGLVLADPALARAAGEDLRLMADFDWLDEDGVVENGQLAFRQISFEGADYTASAKGRIDGFASGFRLDGSANLEASDLSRFSDLAGRPLGGALTASIEGEGSPLGGAFDFDFDGRGENLISGIEQLDAILEGALTVALNARRGPEGVTIEGFNLTSPALSAKASGVLRSDGTDLDLTARLDDLGRIVPEAPGPATVTANLAESVDGIWSGNVTLTGPAATTADLSGTLTADMAADITFDAAVGEVEKFVPQIEGQVTAKGSAQLTDGDWSGHFTMNAPYSSTAVLAGSYGDDGAIAVTFDAAMGEIQRFVPQINGTVTARGSANRTDGNWNGNALIKGPSASQAILAATLEEHGPADITFNAKLAQIERFVPEIRGDATLEGTATRADGLWTGDVALAGPTQSRAVLSGTLAEDGSSADVLFDATMTNVERLVPEIRGNISAKGTAQMTDGLWQVDTAATGPAGIATDVAGTYDQTSGIADMEATGQLLLGVVNRFISPNSVNGIAKFDLSLKGKPGVEALSGTISTAGASVAVPSVAQALTGLSANITLADSNAQVQAGADLRAGGRVTVSGPVALADPFDTRMTVGLDNIVITDNISYSATANGQIVYAGPAVGNGNLSGNINFAEGEINLATASGSIGAAPIPEISHSAEGRLVHRTRKNAGLVVTEKEGKGPVIGLDVALVAPNKVFVRGRGVQAELGGKIHVGGTSAAPVPSGKIEMIRGIIDILGSRLKLTDGRVELRGQFEPYIVFAATTSTDDGQATLEISGPMSSPKIEVTSVPERPSEEALAMLVFGNRFSELSPLKIAQLAAQLATLGGIGGGLGEEAREGLGVDTLDVGSGGLGAGKYISENVYTDFNVNTRGETEVHLNLDVTDNLTVKGTVDNSGNTGIGLYFERDY